MIVTAVQRGAIVYVYGSGNRILTQKQGTLMGYTSNSVSIKNGMVIYVYDATGRLISSHHC